jgi:aminoglycoside phosphotransferase (APT) family kinase protein
VMSRPERIRFATLVDEIWPSADLLTSRPLTGGVSAQTTLLEIRLPDGDVGRFVVREHGARDLARDPDIAVHEFQLLAALHRASLPVPKPIAVVRISGNSDRQAVVMEFVEGEIIHAKDLDGWEVSQFACWLAKIHGFDLASADLSFLVARGYEVVSDGPGAGDPPLVRKIVAALEGCRPRDSLNDPVLLHGDFWRGNLLWQGRTLAAIIDWEDASIGDPVLDVARTRMEIALTLGIDACERFTSEYCSYRRIALTHLPWWELVTALGTARALPGWRLAPEREAEMMDSLERFVDHAIERLN